MELTIAKRDLLKSLSRVQGIADRKSTLAILSNVLLSTEGATVRLSATDLYLGMSGIASADIKRPGTVAIPAKDLFERVKMMPEGPVHLATADKGMVTLKSPGSARKYTVKAMPGEDFPPLPAPADGASSLTLEARVLADLISRVHFSMSTDDARANMACALFEWAGDVVRMVTTDGHRLSKAEVKLEGRQASASFLIPTKAIAELRRFCDDALSGGGKDDRPVIHITQSGTTCFFQFAETTFSTKLIDAAFPPYEKIFESVHVRKSIEVPRAKVLDAVRAVSVAAEQKTGGVKLALDGSKLRITTQSAESGDASDELDVEYTGESGVWFMNGKYVVELLGSLTEDDVTFGFSGELDPVSVIGGATHAIISPMRG